MKRSFVLGCALLLGCGDGSGPGAAGGRYDLILVDDQPLPKLLGTFGFSGTQHLVAQGDLFFDGNATIQRTSYDQKASGGAQTAAFTDSTRSASTKSGTTLVVAHMYGLTEVRDTGYVDGSLLIIRQNLKNNLGQMTAAKYTLKYQRQ
jgi:hypothetical protein